MYRARFSLPLLALALFACAPIPISTPTPASISATLPSARPTPTLAAIPSPRGSGGRLIVSSASMSIVVEEPSLVLTQIETLVDDAGGYVESASSWSPPEGNGYANLRARVPVASLPGLRQAVLELSLQVQSDSAYTQDVTSEYRVLNERLAQILRAEAHLWRLLSEAGEVERTESLLILRDLLQMEKRNVEEQIRRYESQAALASFDITLNQPTAVLRIDE